MTNDKGIASKPDQVNVTVTLISAPLLTEEPPTIYDFVKNIIKNHLNVTDSIESSQEMINLLTDDNRDNDRLVCELIGNIGGKQMNNIQEIIDC